MKLRFPIKDVESWANRYSYPRVETELLDMAPKVKKSGFLDKEQLQIVCNWKSPRSAGHVSKNGDEFVKEITSFSLGAKSPRAAIETLTIIDGVRWPTASVILHLFHKDNYPILDFRALWSLSEEVPSQYTYSFWEGYFQYARDLADKAGVSMRTLDRALWQYSKSEQRENT